MAGDAGAAVAGIARRLASAAVVGERTARMEGATGRRIDRVRDLARDGPARPPAGTQVRDGVEQHARIGMAGPGEQFLGRRDLGETAERTPTSSAMCRTTARLWVISR